MPEIEVTCPACGGLVEAPDIEELIVRAREHTIDAHGYDIPADHVRDSAVTTGAAPRPTQCEGTSTL